MVKIKDPKKVAMGKKNRAAGARFERKIRHDLEAKGWTVDRWSNQLSLENENIVPAKAHFGMRTTGFPDFIAFRYVEDGAYELIGVECKSNGYLKPEEKQKCQIYLDKGIFSKMLIARKGKKRGTIVYEDFTTKLFKRGGKIMEDGLQGDAIEAETTKTPAEEVVETTEDAVVEKTAVAKDEPAEEDEVETEVEETTEEPAETTADEETTD